VITPVRALLVPTSSLHAHIGDGLVTVKDSHWTYIESSIRARFTDSIDLDKALEPGHEQENRWDYLLGWGAEDVIALEPHSATNHEVKTVIAKKRAAMEQLASHKSPKRSVKKWFWVASGKNDLTPLDKKRLILAQHGISFVAPMLSAKHLPSAPPDGQPKGSQSAAPVFARPVGKARKATPRQRR